MTITEGQREDEYFAAQSHFQIVMRKFQQTLVADSSVEIPITFIETLEYRKSSQLKPRKRGVFSRNVEIVVQFVANVYLLLVEFNNSRC